MVRFTDERYDTSRVVRIVNVKQIAYYLKYIKPVDIYTGYDNRLVAVFDKEETRPYYDKWLAYDIEDSEE